MGELLDALNELDERATAPDKPIDSFVDLAAHIFRAASRTVNGAIEVLAGAGYAAGYDQPLDAAGAAASPGNRLSGRRARGATPIEATRRRR